MRKFRIRFSNTHFMKADHRPSHGPQSWPWWRQISFSLVNLTIHSPSSGKRLWIYTRYGAVYAEYYIDRRVSA